MTYYNTMYEYVENADFSDYEISDGEIRETPFVDDIEPADDPDFIIGSDCIGHNGKWYRKVNFGENEESYLLESALYDVVYLRYIETDYGHYVAENGRAYETREEAEKELETMNNEITIKNGLEFERIDARNYAIRPVGNNFVDDLGNEYYAHVYHNGEEWVSTAVSGDDTNPEYMPVYIQMCKDIEETKASV